MKVVSQAYPGDRHWFHSWRQVRGLARVRSVVERSHRPRSRRRKSGAAASSSQQVKRLSVLGNKPLDVGGASTQKICDLLCRGVSKAHLNNLRRMPTNQRPGLEIIVLRNDEEAFGSSERPDLLIIVARESHVAHVATVGEPRNQNGKSRKDRF